MTHMTIETAEQLLRRDGALVDIGQLGPDVVKAAKRAVSAGRLVKYRGHWDTFSPHYGMGPLKTIYAWPRHPRFAQQAA